MAASNANITNYNILDIPCPILMRWWKVGVAATYLLDNWDLIYVVYKGVICCDNADVATNKITTWTQTLINNKIIKYDVHLITVYHKYFLFKHFYWLKIDEDINPLPKFPIKTYPTLLFYYAQGIINHYK